LRTHNSRFRTTRKQQFDVRRQTIGKLKSGFRDQINETTIQRSRTGSGFIIGGDGDGAQDDVQGRGLDRSRRGSSSRGSKQDGTQGGAPALGLVRTEATRIVRVRSQRGSTFRRCTRRCTSSGCLPGSFGFGVNGALNDGSTGSTSHRSVHKAVHKFWLSARIVRTPSQVEDGVGA
jgi:hypothetical protein